MNELDSFDRAILTILQEDALVSYAALGDRVNLSASASLRRVQRMKANGTIIATRIIVDPEALGHMLTICVEIALEKDHSAALTETQNALVADPSVQKCYYMAGDADLFLVLAVPNMSAYKAFTERHFAGKPNIRRFHTSVVMDRIKDTTALPV